MNIDQLRSMGLVSSNPLVRREIAVRYRPLLPREQWAEPGIEEREEKPVEATITVWLRKLTAADQIAVASAQQAGRDYAYTLLHRCCFQENGARVFETEEIAAEVDLSMFKGLIEEINRVNGIAGKKSQPRKSSGASSLSSSAVDPLQNGKNASPSPSSASGSSTAESTAH